MSLYVKWFHWILNEFTSCNETEPNGMQWIPWSSEQGLMKLHPHFVAMLNHSSNVKKNMPNFILLMKFWWYFSDKRNNIVTDYFVLKFCVLVKFCTQKKGWNPEHLEMYLGSANMMHYICGDATGMSWNMLFDTRCCPLPRQFYNEQREATSVWVLQHSDWNVLYHLTI